MKIDYKKELETAAKTMILVHRPDTLIKMIVRTIVSKVKVTHAGILLYDQKRSSYTFTVSRGIPGIKIPAGFARIKIDNPLIKIFTDDNVKKLLNDSILLYDYLNTILRKKRLIYRDFVLRLKNQMDIFEAEVCIPSFMPIHSMAPQPRITISDIKLSTMPEPSYIRQNALLGILLMGRKLSRKKFVQEELDFFTALSNDVAMAIRNAQLFEELQLELGRKYRLFIHTILALAATIDAKDHYTRGHTERVTAYSLAIAKKIISVKKERRFSSRFLENLHVAALLHDIGKIGVSETILNKHGQLTEEERKRIEEHTLIGVAILQSIKDEMEESIEGVKYHHERYDGGGYPEGLKGEKIPLIASIIAVADVFDALTTDRPYRPALSREDAVKEIARCSGSQFNPTVANTFIELHKENKL